MARPVSSAELKTGRNIVSVCCILNNVPQLPIPKQLKIYTSIDTLITHNIGDCSIREFDGLPLSSIIMTVQLQYLYNKYTVIYLKSGQGTVFF